VHFDTHLEEVKWFLAGQKPLAVSRDGSPCWETSEGDTTDTTMQTVHGAFIPGSYPFPAKKALPMQVTMLRLKPILVPTPLPSSSSPEPWHFHVRLDSLTLTPSPPTLTGTIFALNLAYSKRIQARFTFDNWATTSEISASYVSSLKNGAFDRFEFHVPLAGYGYGGPGGVWLEGRRMELCIRYWIEGREWEMWWDNNAGRNYVVGFEMVDRGLARKRRQRIAASTWAAFEESDSSPGRTPDAESRAGNEEDKGTHLKARYDFGRSFQQGAWVPSSSSPSVDPGFAKLPKLRRMTMPMSSTSSFSMLARTRGSPREAEWVVESTTPAVENPVDRRHARSYERTSYFDFVPSMEPGDGESMGAVAATQFEDGSSRNADAKNLGSVNIPNSSQAHRPSDLGYAAAVLAAANVVSPSLSNAHHYDPSGLISPSLSMAYTDTDLDLSLTTPSLLTSPDVLSPVGEDGPSGLVGRGALTRAGAAMGMGTDERNIKVGSQGYYSFVDQFCFFTGAKNATATAATQDEDLKERVEDYLSVALKAF